MKRFSRNKLLILVLAITMLLAGCGNTSVSESALLPESSASSVSAPVEETTSETAPIEPLSTQTFEDIYGSQLSTYIGYQYYFEGEPLPIAETDYYIIDSFYTLNQYAAYGYYPMNSEGYIDLAASVESSSEEEQDIENYGEFLIEYAEGMIESTCIINKYAEEEGVTLTEATLEEIDAFITNIQTTIGEPEGLSIDEVLKLYYGESCSEEAMREILRRFYLADVYTTNYIENYEFTDEELYVPTVRYALFYAPETADEATAEAAMEAANSLVEETAGSLDSFEVLGNAAYTSGESMQYGEVTVSRGQMVADFEAWAYDEARVEGDIETIYAPEYGYFAVAYVGITEIDDSMKASIATGTLSESVTGVIDEGVYSFTHDGEFGLAPTTAPVEPVTPVEGTSEAIPLETTPTGETPATAKLSEKTVYFIVAILAAVIIILAVFLGYYISLSRKVKNSDNKASESKETPKKKQESDSSKSIDEKKEDKADSNNEDEESEE